MPRFFGRPAVEAEVSSGSLSAFRELETWESYGKHPLINLVKFTGGEMRRLEKMQGKNGHFA